jgi:hypothetical protein
MASAPQYKVYDATGEYVGCAKDPALCAAMVAFLGEGSAIRFGHTKRGVFWTEGVTGEACESYDAVCIEAERFKKSLIEKLTA